MKLLTDNYDLIMGIIFLIGMIVGVSTISSMVFDDKDKTEPTIKPNHKEREKPGASMNSTTIKPNY